MQSPEAKTTDLMYMNPPPPLFDSISVVWDLVSDACPQAPLVPSKL